MFDSHDLRWAECRRSRKNDIVPALARLLGECFFLVFGLWLLAGASVAAAADKPSIVLVLTDDQDLSLVDQMPNVEALLVRQGATFKRAYVNEPLCCPSRATILTGRYAHNTGVTENRHALFHNAGLADRTFAVWLRAAGYRTALIGKYFNQYPDPVRDTYVPPGWDLWAARLGDESTQYDYTLNEDGRLVRYGGAQGDYATDVYRRKAVAFVRQAAADRVPFVLELSVHAPHRPSTPAARHESLFPRLKAPRPPSFDEADVSDKPAYIRRKARLSPDAIAGIDAQYRDRARSLRAVDEAVKAIVDALAAAGRLDDTYVVLTSDNGFLQGLHRVRGMKGPPYEEDIRVPLLVRGPGIRPGLVLRHLVGNVDLAPTFAEWAGATAAGNVDGRSFAALLRPGAPGPEAWRQAYPLMFVARDDVPGWRGVRTRRYAYVEYETGERELYDMAADPYQLRNAVGSADAALLARLSRLTADLNGCAGAQCRRLEDARF